MEAWADEYGPIFRRPGPFGSGEVILMDPRALAHWGSNLEVRFAHARPVVEAQIVFHPQTVYHQLPLYKTFIENLTGRGVLWADGELHKRQRRALAGGFTVGRVRDLVPLFLDNAHKCCAAWDAAFDARAGDAGESDGGTIVLDVAHWMSAVALDTIGIASFDHDFRSLAGEQSVVAAQFAALGAAPSTALSAALALLTFTFPVLERLPSKRHRDVAALNASCYTLAQKLYARERADREGGEAKDGADKSIMGLLLRAESATGGSRMSAEQITAQMRTLMIAGYDAPSCTVSSLVMRTPRY
jgi:cytochrome P450